MRIAFLITSLEHLGPNIFVHNLIEGLKEFEGFECEVFYFKKQTLYKGLPLLAFSCKTTRLSISKKHRFVGFDIIHSTSAVPDIYVAIHRLYKNTPCITSMHNFMKEDLLQRKKKIVGYFDLFLWGNSIKKFPHIIVSSSFMKDYYLRHIKENNRFSIIPYGIPDIVFDAVDEQTVGILVALRKSYQILVGCGTLIKRKGFHLLVQYLEHNDKVAVVLIGCGECESELRQQADSLGVRDRLLFLGFREKSSNLYPYADVFCMCSNSEGFGLAMLEGMAAGLPIVCSNLPIYRDYFGSKDVGLFDVDNQDGFNQAVDNVLDNIDYYALRARSIYEKEFSIKSCAERHLSLYNRLLLKS